MTDEKSPRYRLVGRAPRKQQNAKELMDGICHTHPDANFVEVRLGALYALMRPELIPIASA